MGFKLWRPHSSGWQRPALLGGVTGDLWMKRTGDLVEVATRGLVPGADGVVDLVDIPSGWRPDAASSTRLGTISTNAGTTAMASYYAGKFRLINATATGAFGGRISWTVDA